ncbi:MAG: hypothetical protein CVU84_16115 [Firmicutes bacterium HGW-Firmicutes-1]|jgi:hypothetical protein|nr:MAG: hypothetical protein CVU84_16115 [Firmicutes bacterium HGW-Firmicutes-1]
MIKLIKYELLRKQNNIFISLIILAFLELGILFGIYKGGEWILLSMVFIFTMIAGGILMVFIDTIRSYSFDLNQKQGYSLFLTPTSGYKIIGSKGLVSLIELLFVVIVVFGLMFLNFQFTKTLYYDQINQVSGEIFHVIKQSNVLPSLGQFFLFVTASTFEWFTVIMIAILAITLRKTILSDSKIGWIISLVFFIAIYSLMEIINATALASFGFIGDMNEMVQLSSTTPDPSVITEYIYKYLRIACALFPIYIGVLFYFSGKLLNKRVDL